MRKEIDQFLSSNKIAVAGVSRNPNKFGSSVYRELKKKGYNLVPVNPLIEEFEGEKCYSSLAELPPEVDGLLCVVKPESCEKLMKTTEGTGIKSVWMQQGAQSENAVAAGKAAGLDVVHKACILMYADPVNSIHKFHRGLARLFGGYHRARET